MLSPTNPMTRTLNTVFSIGLKTGLAGAAATSGEDKISQANPALPEYPALPCPTLPYPTPYPTLPYPTLAACTDLLLHAWRPRLRC